MHVRDALWLLLRVFCGEWLCEWLRCILQKNKNPLNLLGVFYRKEKLVLIKNSSSPVKWVLRAITICRECGRIFSRINEPREVKADEQKVNQLWTCRRTLFSDSTSPIGHRETPVLTSHHQSPSGHLSPTLKVSSSTTSLTTLTLSMAGIREKQMWALLEFSKGKMSE